MNWLPTRDAALARLEDFLPWAGRDYAATRNFDRGPERRSTVSGLSPYLRHRVLTEREVLSRVLSRHSPVTAAKFIEEVFWRTYWKGWLEHRPSVWKRYQTELLSAIEALSRDDDIALRYAAATAGETGLDLFDQWSRELVTTGYLHNHTRMWFASIWIFTLKLPWTLGADFFLRHLLDGDPASNTLSWRWVAGLQTQGKIYLARPDNIARHYQVPFAMPEGLTTEADPLSEAPLPPAQPPTLPASVTALGRVGLLLTEEDLSLDSLPDAIAVKGMALPRRLSPLPISRAVVDFTSGVVEDAVRRAAGRFNLDRSDIAHGDDAGREIVRWARRLDLDAVVTAYAPVSPTASALVALEGALNDEGISLLRRCTDYDRCCWPDTTRGYFQLKKRIPALLETLAIRRPEQQAS